jgi:hypothetical protein
MKSEWRRFEAVEPYEAVIKSMTDVQPRTRWRCVVVGYLYEREMSAPSVAGYRIVKRAVCYVPDGLVMSYGFAYWVLRAHKEVDVAEQTGTIQVPAQWKKIVKKEYFKNA